MTVIYQQDTVTLDATRITDATDPIFGNMTVFHDVVIASEIVQQYNDGMAFKPRDELEKYAPYVDGGWVVVGGHPQDGIVSETDQVAGRTVNVRYVKDLLDATKRPCRAGIRADMQIFNDKVPPELLADMKSGAKPDVSIGFFFTKDDTPGIVEKDTCKGQEYDYVQRNMFPNHVAAGIDNGRCPSPLCGLGADEMRKMLVGDPFAGYPDFDACKADIASKNPDLSDESVEKICGSLKEKHEDNIPEDNLVKYASKILSAIMDLNEEIEALKGERDAVKETKEVWWRQIDWSHDDFVEAFNHLTEDTQTQIINAGLCPTCGDEEHEEECPDGEHMVDGKCVPKDEDSGEDVLESNPGFTHPAPAAEEECSEGMTWNAEKKQCVAIADFSDLPENKKVDAFDRARKALEKTDKLL